MSEERPSLLPPLHLIVLDAAGAILLGIGLAGALSDALDGLIPMFADKQKAWLCAALGAVLLAWAVPGILGWARDAARRGR